MNCKNNMFSTGHHKLLSFPQKLRAFLHSQDFVPITLEIQPTERCNHMCPQCQAHLSLSRLDARNRASQGVDIDMSLLDSVWDKKPSGIVISGNTGEPLMHPEICTLIERIQTHNIPLAFITNGELINKENAKLLIQACTGIRISLDAYNHISYKGTHGVSSDSWDRVLCGISYLQTAKKQTQNPNNCSIGVGYLTDVKTKDGMEPATLLAKKMGLDYIQFRPFHFSKCDIKESLQACNRHSSGNEFRVFSSYQKYGRLLNPGRTYESCNGSNFYTVIDARGDLYICCHHIGEQNACYGSLNNNTWADLIKSNNRKSVISNYPNEQCVPLCRLNLHNEFLETLLNETDPVIDDNKQPQNHDYFL